MRRKTFIKLGLFTVGAVVTGRAVYAYFESFDELAKKIITEGTAGLNIDQDVYDRFFDEVASKGKWDTIFFPHHKKLMKAHYYTSNSVASLPYRTSYDINRGKLIGMFLLSTDYFYKRENNKVKYLGFYDPYQRPCSNPFSSIYHQS